MGEPDASATVESAPAKPSKQRRPDVRTGRVADTDFWAGFASVIGDKAGAECSARFPANTYPTHGLGDLLANMCRRRSGATWPARRHTGV